MSFNLTIAWKASPTRTPPPICTSALGPQTALVWRAAGAASTPRDTAWLVCRNENDSARVPAKSTSHSQNQAMAPMRGGKVLNLYEDSKCRTAVIFLAVAQNKFTNCLRSSRSKMDFQTTDRRYADKWLRKRVFFCSSEQGNPQRRQTLRCGRDCNFEIVRMIDTWRNVLVALRFLKPASLRTPRIFAGSKACCREEPPSSWFGASDATSTK
jgi:hypothetical protein